MTNNAILYNVGFLITYYCAFYVCESELFDLRVWISKWKPKNLSKLKTEYKNIYIFYW